MNQRSSVFGFLLNRVRGVIDQTESGLPFGDRFAAARAFLLRGALLAWLAFAHIHRHFIESFDGCLVTCNRNRILIDRYDSIGVCTRYWLPINTINDYYIASAD